MLAHSSIPRGKSSRSLQSFPIHQEVEVVVTSDKSLPQPDGYGPADAMIEVLVEAGILSDERLVSAEQYLTDPDSTGYSITLKVLNL
jgi:hypothetical protein